MKTFREKQEKLEKEIKTLSRFIRIIDYLFVIGTFALIFIKILIKLGAIEF